MHYNVLFLLLVSSATLAQFYEPLYGPLFPIYDYRPYPVEVKVEPEHKKDRRVYTSRYENEVTALPETDGPDVYTIDCPPINPYEHTEIIIMEYDD